MNGTLEQREQQGAVARVMFPQARVDAAREARESEPITDSNGSDAGVA